MRKWQAIRQPLYLGRRLRSSTSVRVRLNYSAKDGEQPAQAHQEPGLNRLRTVWPQARETPRRETPSYQGPSTIVT